MKTALLLCLVFTLNTPLLAQGFNNTQYAYDDKDLNMISSMLGIEAYKFYVDAKASKMLEIVVEEYNMGKLKSSKNIISDFHKNMGMDIAISTIDSSYRIGADDFVRLYVKVDADAKNQAELAFSYFGMSGPINFGDLGLKYLMSMAFRNIPTTIEVKTPVVVIFGSKEEPISTPGVGKEDPKDMVKMYDWVAIVYLKPINQNKTNNESRKPNNSQ